MVIVNLKRVDDTMFVVKLSALEKRQLWYASLKLGLPEDDLLKQEISEFLSDWPVHPVRRVTSRLNRPPSAG